MHAHTRLTKTHTHSVDINLIGPLQLLSYINYLPDNIHLSMRRREYDLLVIYLNKNQAYIAAWETFVMLCEAAKKIRWFHAARYSDL